MNVCSFCTFLWVPSDVSVTCWYYESLGRNVASWIRALGVDRVQIYRLCVYTEHPDRKTLGFLIAALREFVLIHQTSLGEILEWGCCRKRGTWYLRKTWTLFCFYSGVSDSQTALRNRERVKGRETERVRVKDEREWDCERITTALPELLYCLQAERRSHVIQYSNASTAQCGNEIWGPSTCPGPRKKREKKIEMLWEVRN